MSVVAIVGRPNVGKSTLFNRILGRRKAIVDDVSGVTRDRNYGNASWTGREFTLVDTGGLDPTVEEGFFPLIREQAMLAINEADVILFILDTRDGLTPADMEIADVLRRTEKSVIVTANKSEGDRRGMEAAEFFELGLGSVLPVSAIHGAGVAELLEERIRGKYESQDVDIELNVHVIGFAKAIGDIADGAARVILFFALTFAITALLVFANTRSFRLTAALLGSALMAVVWQLGLLTAMGYGIDPMSVLIPFLIFAIAISHGVQMVNNHNNEVSQGAAADSAARTCFKRLLIPSTIALASDTIGFITIYLIEIRVIQEMAITASVGVAVIIFINLLLLPVLLSYIHPKAGHREKLAQRAARMNAVWRVVAKAATAKPATGIILFSLLLLIVGAWKATDVKIGDLQRGVPELRAESRYNVDSEVISDKFSIGVDVLTVIVETQPEGCINYDIMSAIDHFQWAMRNVEGVQSVIAMPGIVRIINAGWNEGSLKWRVIPRNPSSLAQSVAYIPTSSGLLNNDCSVMPVMIFTADHKATTISTIIAAVKGYRIEHPRDDVQFLLATGNVGVMAATNAVKTNTTSNEFASSNLAGCAGGANSNSSTARPAPDNTSTG